MSTTSDRAHRSASSDKLTTGASPLRLLAFE